VESVGSLLPHPALHDLNALAKVRLAPECRATRGAWAVRARGAVTRRGVAAPGAR
jgi:hypothetical protein